MALKQTLSASQSLGLALTPVMRQALQLLRLSSAELSDLMLREAAANPFLKVSAPRGLGIAGGYDAEIAAPAPTLMEDLAAQLRMMPLAEPVRQVALYLAADIADDGYLAADALDDLRARGVDAALMDAGLAALHQCAPAGIGARDLAECLTLQLCDAGLEDAVARQTVADLPLLAAEGGASGRLAHRWNVPQAEVARRADLVRQLRPRVIDPTDAPPILTYADLIVRRQTGTSFGVDLNRDDLPTVSLHHALAAQAAQDNFARGSMARAQEILAALHFRGKTLLSIGQYLLEHQFGFFAHGPDHLRPMTRAAVAQALGVHPSTISRAVAEKAIDCDGRIWPLSVFFSSALLAVDDQTISGFVVQRRIGAMIGRENPLSPLSDAAIARALNAEGVDIARRTVAKYREGLRIPASSTRRQRAKSRHVSASPRPSG